MSSGKKAQPYSSKLRGIEALLGSIPEEPSSTSLNTLPIDSIVFPTEQPRRYFDPEKLAQLTESIRHHGILEPILVRPLEPPKSYELIAGERRLRAAKEIGLVEVPVTIREISAEEAIQLALIENLQREDLNPVEETEGILKLLSIRLEMSVEEISKLLYQMRNEVLQNSNQNVLIKPEAQTITKVFDELATLSWESFITTRLPLLNLQEEILNALRTGQIAYTKAQIIARINDETVRSQILNDAIQLNLSIREIKDKIQAISSKESAEQTEPTLKKRMDLAYKAIKKSKLWDDPKQRKKIEKLIENLETIASEI